LLQGVPHVEFTEKFSNFIKGWPVKIFPDEPYLIFSAGLDLGSLPKSIPDSVRRKSQRKTVITN
jgi:hypothetical protein